VSYTTPEQVYPSSLQVKAEYDKLSRELRAGLISDEQLIERRHKLIHMEYESLKPYRLEKTVDDPDCFMCREEERGLAHRVDEPMLMPKVDESEKVRGIRI
jgi:hypothetical protein